jgi:hypothetical protein
MPVPQDKGRPRLPRITEALNHFDAHDSRDHLLAVPGDFTKDIEPNGAKASVGNLT